jgi:hypothetical protein
MSELQGIARFKIHEGKLEEFKRLSARCMEIVRTKDTGTLQYEIYFNDDQSECMISSGTGIPRRSSSTLRTLATQWRRSLRRALFPANSSVSGAQSSERRWLTARSVSSRPASRCGWLTLSRRGSRSGVFMRDFGPTFRTVHALVAREDS